MSFNSGKVSFCIYKYNEDLPDDLLDQLAAKALPDLDSVGKDPVLGWASRHFLEKDFSHENVWDDSFAHFNFVQASKKAPAPFLKAECQRREIELMKEGDMRSLSKKKKIEIRDEIEEELLKQSLPNLKGVEVLIDSQEKIVYLGTTSVKMADTVISLLIETTEMAPIPVTPMALYQVLTEKNSHEYNKLRFVDEAAANPGDESEVYPGRDFLTWLWYRSESGECEFSIPNLGVANFAIDGPVKLVADVSHSMESVLRKGVPTQSPEAASALAGGKKLSSAKLAIAIDQDVWTCTLDADNFCFKTMALPEGTKMGLDEFAERAENLLKFDAIFTVIYKEFLRLSENEMDKLNENMQEWLNDKLASQ